jgi:ABC-type multidrug transport system fused ATPase/permease subunit
MLKIFKLWTAGLNALTQTIRLRLWIHCAVVVTSIVLDGFSLVLFSKGLEKALGTHTASDSSRIAFEIGFSLLLMATKSVFLLVSTNSLLNKLAYEEARIAMKNVASLEIIPWEKDLQINLSQRQLSINDSPYSLVQGIVYNGFVVIAQILNIFGLLAISIYLTPAATFAALFYFLLVIVLQHRFISRANSRVGENKSKYLLEVNELINESFALRKSLRIMPSISYQDVLFEKRLKLAQSRSKQLYLWMAPRLVLEISFALGIALVCIFYAARENINSAIYAVGILGILGMRALPAISQVQASIYSFLVEKPIAEVSIGSDHVTQITKQDVSAKITEHLDDRVQIRFENVFYQYQMDGVFVLNNVNLELEIGKYYGLVGKSGSGKTTFSELCLGFLEPTLGHITHSAPSKRKYAYVPQEPIVLRRSLEENIAMEFNGAKVNRDRIEFIKSHFKEIESLREVINNRSNDISGISGGQKQLVAFMRAIYRDPTFLVLDEATSALDGRSAEQLFEIVEEIRGRTTILSIAHRHEHLAGVDHVVVMRDGCVSKVSEVGEILTNLDLYFDREQN